MTPLSLRLLLIGLLSYLLTAQLNAQAQSPEFPSESTECHSSSKGKCMNSSDKEHVRQALKSWLQAFNNKDYEAFSALYDPEVLYSNNSAPLKRGATEVVSSFKPAFSSEIGTLQFLEEAVFQDGNLALIVGKFYFRPSDDTDPDETGATGRVALVYRRSLDGRWLLLYDMDNKPPDSKPEDFERFPSDIFYLK